MMFDENYKNAMNKIQPSEAAITSTLDAMNNNATTIPHSKTIMRIALISCFVVILVCLTLIAAFNNSNELDSNIPPSEDRFINMNITDISAESMIVDATDNNVNKNSATEEIPEISFNENTGLIPFDSYESIFELVEYFQEQEEYEEIVPMPSTPEEDLETEGSDCNSILSGDNNVPDYFDTNNQVSGVQEADYVKTDGKYIYYCNCYYDTLNIAEINDGKMKEVSAIKIENSLINVLHEILLYEDKLILIGRYFDMYGVYETRTVIYDISDRSNPKQIKILKQDGPYKSSRIVNGILYLVTTNHALFEDEKEMESIPKINGDYIDSSDIFHQLEYNGKTTFTTITAYDINNGNGNHKSKIAILGYHGEIYVSNGNIYLTNEHYNKLENNGCKTSTVTTYICKVALNNGNLTVVGNGCIPGTVENQFWMDEQDGKLRVATTINYQSVTLGADGAITSIEIDDRINRVYVLNEIMSIIGTSDDLGIGETIKSVRYIDNVAYVVTFRQTDPLYAIDLSNHSNPKTLSELKIDGFSTYMQPYGEGLMIGLGYDADPSTGFTTGLKLTMFDISNPAAVNDISTYSYAYEWENSAMSTAVYNHKAVLIDSKKQIIAMPIVFEMYEHVSDNDYMRKEVLKYAFYEFDGETLTEKSLIKIDEAQWAYDEGWVRGLYIGDYCYIVVPKGITCISLENFEIVDTVSFSVN